MLDALKSQQLRPHFPFSFNISGHHGGVATAMLTPLCVYQIRTRLSVTQIHED
jgi:hypothetical protein